MVVDVLIHVHIGDVLSIAQCESICVYYDSCIIQKAVRDSPN